MKVNEGVHRIVFVLRAIGFLIVTLGFLNPISPERTAWLILVIAAIIVSTPFFALAWIVDGFAGATRREQRDADRMIEEMRRNARLGVDWELRHRRDGARHPDA